MGLYLKCFLRIYRFLCIFYSIMIICSEFDANFLYIRNYLKHYLNLFSLFLKLR